MITIICKIRLDSEFEGPGYGQIKFVFEGIPITLPFAGLNFVAMDVLKKIRVLGDLEQPVCTLYDLTHYFETSGKYFPRTVDSDGELNDDVMRQAFAKLPKLDGVYSHMYMQYDEKDEQVFKNIITKYATVDYSADFDETDENIRKHLGPRGKIIFAGRTQAEDDAEDDAFVNSGNASQSVIGSKIISAKGGRRTRRYKRGGNKKRSATKRSATKPS